MSCASLVLRPGLVCLLMLAVLHSRSHPSGQVGTLPLKHQHRQECRVISTRVKLPPINQAQLGHHRSTVITVLKQQIHSGSRVS